jgi:four helix bundle protein
MVRVGKLRRVGWACAAPQTEVVDVEYATWEAAVPQAITADKLWRVQAYRLALFAADASWHDVTILIRDPRTRSLADQLYRSAGSVSANIAEGYSRGTGPDRCRFLEYALGSARECRDWYYKARHILGSAAVAPRMDVLTQTSRLLLVMLQSQRGRVVRRRGAI